MNVTSALARVTSVEPLEGFRLRLTFTDGLVREVEPLQAAAPGPVQTAAPISERAVEGTWIRHVPHRSYPAPNLDARM